MGASGFVSPSKWLLWVNSLQRIIHVAFVVLKIAWYPGVAFAKVRLLSNALLFECAISMFFYSYHSIAFRICIAKNSNVEERIKASSL